MNPVSIAPTSREIDGDGSSPVSSRYTASPNATRPISSSTAYPRTRIRSASTDVRAVVHSAAGLGLGAIEPVPEVAESGQDVLLLVELAVDGRRVDLDVGPAVLNRSQSLRGGHHGEQANVPGTGGIQQLEGRKRAAARREHRIDEQH